MTTDATAKPMMPEELNCEILWAQRVKAPNSQSRALLSEHARANALQAERDHLETDLREYFDRARAAEAERDEARRLLAEVDEAIFIAYGREAKIGNEDETEIERFDAAVNAAIDRHRARQAVAKANG